MAPIALRIARMLCYKLPHGKSLCCGFVLGKFRGVLRRAGQPLPQKHLADPVSPQDRAGARCARLLGERCGEPQDSASPVLPDAINSPPFRAQYARNAIKLCQSLINERMVTIEDIQY